MRKLIKKILRESDDFEWVEEFSDRPLHNVTFKCSEDYYGTIYTIKDDGLRSSVIVQWDERNEINTSPYMRHTVEKHFESGDWVPIEDPITESDDFEWIRDIKEAMPFDEVMVNEGYDLVINNKEAFLKQLRECSMHTLADSIGDVEFVTVVSTSKLESAQVFCGDDKRDHYDGEKWAVELRFELRDWHMSGHRFRFWVADIGDVSLIPRTKGSPPKALKESDDLDWIRDVEPNVPFENVVKGETYKVEVLDADLFDEMVDFCQMDYINTDDIAYVQVNGKKEATCDYVFCCDEVNVPEEDIGNIINIIHNHDLDKETLTIRVHLYNKHWDMLYSDVWLTKEMIQLQYQEQLPQHAQYQ